MSGVLDLVVELHPHSPRINVGMDEGFADDLPKKELARIGGLDRSTGLARGFGQGHLMARRTYENARRQWPRN